MPYFQTCRCSVVVQSVSCSSAAPGLGARHAGLRTQRSSHLATHIGSRTVHRPEVCRRRHKIAPELGRLSDSFNRGRGPGQQNRQRDQGARAAHLSTLPCASFHCLCRGLWNAKVGNMSWLRTQLEESDPQDCTAVGKLKSPHGAGTDRSVLVV